MSSVDGRLLNGRWTTPFGESTEADLRKVYAAIGKSLQTDAWMFGRNTVQEGFLPYKFTGRKKEYNLPRTSYVAPRESERILILSDPEGMIYYHTSTVRGDNIVTILGKGVTDEYLQHLQEAGISYVFGGEDGYDLKAAMHMLSTDFGIRCISLQGGGILNGAMLEARLVDELSLVIYPGIDGLSGIPSIFEYNGSNTRFPAKGQRLQLLSVEVWDHNAVWLRYQIHKNKK